MNDERFERLKVFVKHICDFYYQKDNASINEFFNEVEAMRAYIKETRKNDKKVVIESCEQCPYVSYKGDPNIVGYIHLCTKSNNEEIPYKVVTVSNVKYFDTSQNISIWCPLENNN